MCASFLIWELCGSRDRLRRFLFPLEEKAVTPQLVYWGALYGIAEMLLSGITTFLDMYYFEDQVAEACRDAGIVLPVVAIGGITAEDIPGIMAAGVHGIAVSGGLLRAEDTSAETCRMLDMLQEYADAAWQALSR